jgi:hypothetical protein
MRTEHGLSLTAALREKTGAQFKINKRGFDTGSRRYTCDTSMAEALVPAIGDADSRFTNMRVSGVNITEGKAGLAEVSVEFEGEIKPGKPHYYDYNTSDQIDSIRTDAGGIYSLTLPIVTHYYVTGVYPTTQIGEYATPGKYSERLPKQLNPRQLRPENSGTGPVWDTYWFGGLNAGWRLTSRQISESGPLYSVVDVYTYYINVTSVVEIDGSSSPVSS